MVIAAGFAAIALAGAPAVAQTPMDKTDTNGAPPTATRRAAEDLARDATRAFDRYLEGKPLADVAPEPTPKTAQVRTPLPPVAGESGSDWLQRIERSYGELIQRLSEPTVPNPVQDAARRQALERAGQLDRTTGRQADGEAPRVIVLPPAGDAVAGAPAGDTVPAPGRPWLEREVERRSAEVRTEVMDQLAKRGAASESGRTAGALPPGTSSSEGWMAWLNRGFDEFQRDVVGRLATPVDPGRPAQDAQASARQMERSAGSDPSSPRPEEQPKVLPPVGVLDAGELSRAAPAAAPDTAKAVEVGSSSKVAPDVERKAMEAAEARIVEQQRVEAERRAVEAARRAEVARRVEAARKAAERKAADEARVAEARVAEAREAEARQKAEAARKAAELKAADEARVAEAREAEARRKAEAARKAAELKAADEARVAEAREAEARRKADAARKAADRQFAVDAGAVVAARAEADRRAEARRATVLVAAEAARQAGQAAEETSLQAHRLSEAAKEAQQRVDSLRASSTSSAAAVSVKPRLEGEVSGLGLARVEPVPDAQQLGDAVRASALARQAADAALRTARIVRREADRARLAADAAEVARQTVESAPNARAGQAAAKRLTVAARKATRAAALVVAARVPRIERASAGKQKAGGRPLKALSVGNTEPRPVGAAVVAPLPIRRAAISGRKSRGRLHRGACVGAGRAIKPPGWYVVAPADTLSQIAMRHYNTAQGHPRISRSNARRIVGAGVIRPCQRLYLPK